MQEAEMPVNERFCYVMVNKKRGKHCAPEKEYPFEEAGIQFNLLPCKLKQKYQDKCRYINVFGADCDIGVVYNPDREFGVKGYYKDETTQEEVENVVIDPFE